MICVLPSAPITAHQVSPSVRSAAGISTSVRMFRAWSRRPALRPGGQCGSCARRAGCDGDCGGALRLRYKSPAPPHQPPTAGASRLGQVCRYSSDLNRAIKPVQPAALYPEGVSVSLHRGTHGTPSVPHVCV